MRFILLIRLTLLIFFFFIYCTSFSQNTWQENTKKADSLELRFNFKDALKYRIKAMQDVNIPKDTLVFLKLLKNISIEEANITDKKLRKEAYFNLKKYTEQLKNSGAKPERLYQSYRRLYIFAHNYMRNWKETYDLIEKSIEQNYKCKKMDSTVLFRMHHSYGVLSRELGYLNKSINIFNKAIEIYQTLNKKDTNMLGAVYTDLSSVYNNKYLNIPHKLEHYLKKAEQIFASVKKPNLDYFTAVYYRLGEIEIQKGNYDLAIGFNEKSYQLYIKNKEKTQHYRMGNIGIAKDLIYHSFAIFTYLEISRNKKAKEHINQVLQLIKNKKLSAFENDFLSNTYMYASQLYVKKNNLKSANDYLDKAIDINKNKGEDNLLSNIYTEKVKLLLKEKKYKQAKEFLNKIFNNKSTNTSLKKTAFNKSIQVNLALNDVVSVRQNIDSLLNYIHQEKEFISFKDISYDLFKPNPVIFDTQHFLNIASYLENSNFKENTQIDKLYNLALKQFKENFNNYTLNQKINPIYSKIATHFYNKQANNQLTDVEKTRFLDFTENIDSKYLLQTFYKNHLASNNNKLKKLFEKEQLIRSENTFLKKKFLSKNSDSIKQLIFENNIRLKKLGDTLFTEKRGFASLKNNYHDVLQKLKNNYIIKYKLINNKLYRIVFYKEKQSVYEIKNYDSVKQIIKKHIVLLKNPASEVNRIKQTGRLLYQVLLSNINLNDVDKIFIIPDDILTFLSFETLVDNNDYLIKNHTISYANSISFLAKPSFKTDIKNKEKDIAVFAPSYKTHKPTEVESASRGTPYYLEGAIKEADAVSKILNSELFIKEQAKKSIFQNISNKYSIIHLSMHSYLNDKDSELNSLAFTDSENDYKLHISELYGMNLDADLVVLSACNTGIGKIQTGKGVVSLNTAFTASGVPAVVSSLWSVPDTETKEIMINFYTYLKKGWKKNKALKQAKLDFIKNTKSEELKHPHYWASFVLYGDTSPVKFKSFNNYYLLIFTVIFVILFFIVVRKLK